MHLTESGPGVIYSVCVWENPTFSEEWLEIVVVASAYLRKHLNALSFADKLNSCLKNEILKQLI